MRLAGGHIFGWAQLVVSGNTLVQFYIRPKFLMVLVLVLLVEVTSTVTPTLASTQQPTSASTPTSKDAPTTFWAWGYNGYGQLGDETTANRKLPVHESRGGRPPGPVSPLVSITQSLSDRTVPSGHGVVVPAVNLAMGPTPIGNYLLRNRPGRPTGSSSQRVVLTHSPSSRTAFCRMQRKSIPAPVLGPSALFERRVRCSMETPSHQPASVAPGESHAACHGAAAQCLSPWP
jgi:YD repeat-containing protein